ncbi:MAG TPA: hypothetical protein VGL82_14905 [Bryobacteraceae bacterium]
MDAEQVIVAVTSATCSFVPSARILIGVAVAGVTSEQVCPSAVPARAAAISNAEKTLKTKGFLLLRIGSKNKPKSV